MSKKIKVLFKCQQTTFKLKTENGKFKFSIFSFQFKCCLLTFK